MYTILRKFVMSLPYIDTKRNKKRIFCNEMKKNKTLKAYSMSKAAKLQYYRIVDAWRLNNRLLPRGYPMLLPLKIWFLLKMTTLEDQLQACQAAQIYVEPNNLALSVVHYKPAVFL